MELEKNYASDITVTIYKLRVNYLSNCTQRKKTAFVFSLKPFAGQCLFSLQLIPHCLKKMLLFASPSVSCYPSCQLASCHFAILLSRRRSQFCYTANGWKKNCLKDLSNVSLVLLLGKTNTIYLVYPFSYSERVKIS